MTDFLASVQAHITAGLAALERGALPDAGRALSAAGSLLATAEAPHPPEVHKALLSYLTAFGVLYLSDDNASAALSFFLDVARRQSLLDQPTASESALTALHVCDALGRLGRMAEAKKYAVGAVMILMEEASGALAPPGAAAAPTSSLRDPAVQTLLAVAHLRAGAASEALGELREALTAYSWGLEVPGLAEQLRGTLEEALLRVAEALRRQEEAAGAGAAAGAQAGQGQPTGSPAALPLQAAQQQPVGAQAAAAAAAAQQAAAAQLAPPPPAPTAPPPVLARTPGDTRPPYPTMLDETRRVLGLQLPSERKPLSPPRIAKPVAAQQQPQPSGSVGAFYQQHGSPPPSTARSTSRRAALHQQRSASRPTSRAGLRSSSSSSSSSSEQAAQPSEGGEALLVRPGSQGGSASAAQRLLASPFLRTSPRVKFLLSPQARAHARGLRPDWDTSASGKSIKEQQLEDARLKLDNPQGGLLGGSSSSSSAAALGSPRPSSRAGTAASGSGRGGGGAAAAAAAGSASRPATRDGMGSQRRSLSSSSSSSAARPALGSVSFQPSLAGGKQSPSWGQLPTPRGGAGGGGLEGPPSWVLDSSSSMYDFHPAATPLRTEAEAFLQELRGKLGSIGAAAVAASSSASAASAAPSSSASVTAAAAAAAPPPPLAAAAP